MRVLIFCPAIAVTSGSGIRGRLLAEGLSHAGAEVGVVASGGRLDWHPGKIQLYTCGVGVSWRDSLNNAANVFRPDIVFGITEAGADIVRDVAKKNRCHSALDLHGLGFIEVMELGAGYGPRLPRIWNSLKWVSKVLSVDIVTVANPRLYPLLKLFNRNTIPLFGCTDVSMFSPEGMSQRLGTDSDAIQVLYAGNYYKWQGVDLLFEAICGLDDEVQAFEFTFMGSIGQHQDKINQWKSRLPMGRVHFREAVDLSQVPGYYRGADVLVVPRPFMLSTYLAFPQKMSDYMASGRVVLATDIAPHRWALDDSHAGILCPPSSFGLVEGLRSCQDANLRRALGENARQRAKNLFCHLKQGEKLIEIFDQGMEGGIS